ARHPIVSMRLLIAPILFRALRSSDDLGIAAELKGVSHNAHMVSYKPQHFTQADTLAMVLTLFFLTTGILIQVHAGDAPTGFFL
ncbi:MAG: energy-coupling factor transporter transmembrane protein EcfT, partial [Desulfobacterales bacterium]|nr:energy-coupling factor transporter transmembrane protein EcfT [Desulfobacterales bacterium]